MSYLSILKTFDWPHMCSSRTYLHVRPSKPPCRHHNFASENLINQIQHINHIDKLVNRNHLLIKSPRWHLNPPTGEAFLFHNRHLHSGKDAEEQNIFSHLDNCLGGTWCTNDRCLGLKRMALRMVGRENVGLFIFPPLYQNLLPPPVKLMGPLVPLYSQKCLTLKIVEVRVI